MTEGVKYDNDKPRWGLLPYEALEDVVRVLTFGSKKYADDNWKKVPNAKERYFDAMLRHITQYRMGELYDGETHVSHLAHAVCCALFIQWFDRQEELLIEEELSLYDQMAKDFEWGAKEFDQLELDFTPEMSYNITINSGEGWQMDDNTVNTIRTGGFY